MRKNIIITEFIKLSKEEQIDIFSNIETKNDQEEFLKKLKKLKPIIHMKLLSALKSKENINSSLQDNKTETKNTPIKTIPIENIIPNPYQPRKEFAIEKLQELALSIAEDGLIQDIVVTPNPNKKEEFILIAGERRWRAYIINKELYPDRSIFDQIPVKILENIDDENFRKKAIIENISREDMNIIETADAFLSLKQSGMKLNDIHKVTGKSISYISRLTIIASLDPIVKNKVIALKIKSPNMLELIAQKTKVEMQFQLALLEEIANGINMQQLKKKIEVYYNTLNKKKNPVVKNTIKIDTLTLTAQQQKKVKSTYKKLSTNQKIVADELLLKINNLQQEILDLAILT